MAERATSPHKLAAAAAAAAANPHVAQQQQHAVGSAAQQFPWSQPSNQVPRAERVPRASALANQVIRYPDFSLFFRASLYSAKRFNQPLIKTSFSWLESGISTSKTFQLNCKVSVCLIHDVIASIFPRREIFRHDLFLSLCVKSPRRHPHIPLLTFPRRSKRFQ